MWGAIFEIILKLLSFLPDFLGGRKIRKKIKDKKKLLEEMDKARQDVEEGNEQSVNERMEEYRKKKGLK